MVRPPIPLNALRAFEASARHLSFTHAAIELCVTQAAVSHQVKALEQRLGFALFKRLPRGLLLTSEGETLLPTMQQAFDRIADALDRFASGHFREPLMVGAVGTFVAVSYTHLDVYKRQALARALICEELPGTMRDCATGHG